MTTDIIQRFLEHAINVYTGGCVNQKRFTGLFIVQQEVHLMRRRRDIPIECTLQSLLLEQDWVKGLRQSANIVQCSLRDLSHLVQILPQGRTVRSLISEPAQQ